MSDVDNEQPEIKEMMNKMTRYNRNMKALMELMGKVSEELDKVLSSGTNGNDAEEKEKMDKIFAKKQIGRPVGTWKTKREQYVEMLNKGKIKTPKESTLEFYKIVKVGETYVMVGRDE